MRRTGMLLIAAVAAASLAGGCGRSGRTMLSTAGGVGPLDGAAFGVGAWLADASKVETTALVTIYDDDGAATVTSQELTIRPGRRQLTAECRLPEGRWTARVNLDTFTPAALAGFAYVCDHDGLKLSGEQKDEIADRLRLILHRVCGPLNLIDGGEKVTAVEEVFAAGSMMTRCSVAGRPELASAYFFGDRPGGLRLITQGGRKAAEGGTVTVYRLTLTPEGVVAPETLEVSSLGENSLIGRRKILTVKLTDVTIHE